MPEFIRDLFIVISRSSTAFSFSPLFFCQCVHSSSFPGKFSFALLFGSLVLFFFDQFVLYCFDSFFSSRLNRQVIVPNPNTPSATIAYEIEQPNNKHIIMNCLRDCCTEFEQKPTTTTSPDMNFTQKKNQKRSKLVHQFIHFWNGDNFFPICTLWLKSRN